MQSCTVATVANPMEPRACSGPRRS